MLDFLVHEYLGEECKRCGDHHMECPSGCRDPDCPMPEHFNYLEEFAIEMDEEYRNMVDTPKDFYD